MTVPALGRRVAACALAALAAGCNPVSQPRYVVFFTEYSAELDPAAQGVVQEAATAARNAPGRSVTVAGYTDQAVGPAAERQLSQLRAQVVADALAARGVDRSRLALQPRGQASGGDPGVERRRVEVVIR